MKQPAIPASVAAYLQRVPNPQREALEALRRTIKSEWPDTEECIAYGVPGFRRHGKYLAGFAATGTGCSFYPGSIVREFARELEGYAVAKGTVRFDPTEPLPEKVVRKILRARAAQRSGSIP